MEQRQDTANKILRPAVYRPPTAAVTLTPKEIIAILRRHILLIVALTTSGLIASGVAWFVLRKYAPKYTARTYIEVLSPGRVDPMTIGRLQPNKDIAFQHRFSLATLIKQLGALQNLLRRDKIKQTKWFNSFDTHEERVESLEDDFIAFAQRDSQYIIIGMTCHDPKESALITNEMLDSFIKSRKIRTEGDITLKLKELNDQLMNAQRDLDAAEAALNTLRDEASAWGLTMLQARNADVDNIVTSTLNEYIKAENQLSISVKQLEGQIAALQKRVEGELDVVVKHQVEHDPIMVNLAQQLTGLETELARKLTKFGEDHREVRQLREVIKQVTEERRLRQVYIGEQTRRANLDSAYDTLSVLQNQLAEQERRRTEMEAKQKDLDRYIARYRQREDIRNAKKDTLESINAQIVKYNMMLKDPETPKVRPTGLAPVPLKVSSPKWQLYFPSGTLLGFLLGVGLAFLIELINDLVRTPSDVSKHLHIPLLAIIPDAEEDDQIQDDVDLAHVVRQAPYSIISESYRQFRTNLKLSGSAESIKTLLITSGAAGEGKTSTAINLATTFVAEDKKTLFIDANFRRPTSLRIFPKAPTDASDKESAELGLSNLLMGQRTYKDIIRPSGIDGLDIIDSGPLPFNPAVLLGSKRMDQLIKEQREKYDYIIIDSPPVLLVSDTKILAARADATVLVFNAAATRRGAAQRTIRELKEIRANIIGCVLFAVRIMKGGYFDELFRNYQEYQKVQLAHSI